MSPPNRRWRDRSCPDLRRRTAAIVMGGKGAHVKRIKGWRPYSRMARIVTLLVLLVTGCNMPPGTEGNTPGECGDGADNDGDGLFDCNDPDCGQSEDCTAVVGDDDDTSEGDDDDSGDDDSGDDDSGDDDDSGAAADSGAS